MKIYSKYLEKKQLKKKITYLKKKKKKIFLFNGVFDLIHLGNLKYFKFAR